MTTLGFKDYEGSALRGGGGLSKGSEKDEEEGNKTLSVWYHSSLFHSKTDSKHMVSMCIIASFFHWSCLKINFKFTIKNFKILKITVTFSMIQFTLLTRKTLKVGSKKLS